MKAILPSKLTLKSARINRGLTVKEVAKILNKNCQIVLSYEKNSENIPVDLLRKLSKFTNIQWIIFFYNKVPFKRYKL